MTGVQTCALPIYKGILSITIKVFTDNKEPHSAFSSMVPNPAADLISLLNTIYSKNEFQIDCLREKYVLTEEETLILDKVRSEEHTSELQSHSFISYAVFCLKKKKKSII